MATVKFIDIDDNRPASEADNVSEIDAQGMPPNITREKFIRLGNVSGSDITGLPIRSDGQHPDRLQFSFREFGGHSDSLTLNLANGKSQNIYLRLKMPITLSDEFVTTFLTVGSDTLKIIYQSSVSMSSLFDPWPIYEGEMTESIVTAFENAPSHTFVRYDPIQSPEDGIPSRINPPKGRAFEFKEIELCSYLNPNDHSLGYEAPIVRELQCIPTQRNIDAEDKWTQDSVGINYDDGGTVLLLPNFLATLGGMEPLWRFFVHEPVNLIDMYKRTQILMYRGFGGGTYHVDNLHPVLAGHEILYYRATLRVLRDPVGGEQMWRYSPFSHVYAEDSERILRRYHCPIEPVLEDVPGSTGTDGT